MTPMKLISVALIPLALVPLAACTTSGSGPVDVTRFHRANEATLAPGSYSIETPSQYAAGSLEASAWNQAVAAELDKLGFTRTNGAATYNVTVDHARVMIDPALGGKRSPVSVGVGGSTGSYGSGLGVGIGIDLSGPPKPRIGYDLSVRISRNADKEVMWEGRASTETKQGSAADQPNLVATKMASSLFKGFPGENGKSIRIP